MVRCLIPLLAAICATAPACQRRTTHEAWDGDKQLTVTVHVFDATTKRPIRGATVTAVRSGYDTEPDEWLAAMPAPQITGFWGRAKLEPWFRAVSYGLDFFVCVESSFIRVEAPGYRTATARIAERRSLEFADDTRVCEVKVSVSLYRQ